MKNNFVGHNKFGSRILAYVLTLIMVFTMTPLAGLGNSYAASGGEDTRVADNTTLDGWQEYFGSDDENFNTRYAGYVWTDKSVTTDDSAFGYAKELADNSGHIVISDDENNFLVSLSAMAASKSITGQDNKPTDTMIVLDMSSSMYKNSTDRIPGPITAMIDSVNSTIKQLQELNVNNRVGVTVYYGGPDLNQAPANSYQVWLPLDRYKHKDDKFLVAKTSSGKLASAGVNSNVTTESGKAVTATTRTTTVTAGTYMQQGILSALKQFMAADTKVPANAAVNAGETRTPVMVLMSDGKPTAATNYYTQLDRAAIMGSNREDIRSANETDFLTQLTAAYAKAMMDAHYEEETPLLYTLSFGNGFSYTVMDPSGTLEKKNTEHESNPATVSGYWNKLIANNSMSLSYKVSKGQWDANTINKTCTVSKTTVDGKSFPSSASQQYYVDKAFEAATADDLEDAFANIFTDISLQTHTYPTLVDGDENLDGYISFVDKIGEYMNVTDVKGILLGNHWYSGKEFAKNLSALGTTTDPTALGDELVWSIQQRVGIADAATVRTLLSLAYQYGQLAYNSDGSYSNYVGWYSDAQGNYLGFWQDGVTTTPDGATHTNKSYIYIGETDESLGVSESDMMYTTVRVRHEIATNIESVSFAVPAALIPVVEYDVEYDENDKLTSVTRGGADHPIRLVYEVALDDSINERTLRDTVDHHYIAHNTDSEGYVNFYTNQYEVTGDVGYGKVNTYSYFRPSHQNENYYYQENEPVYSDQNGTKYNSSSAPDPSGTYYREITVYSNNNGSIKEENIYRQLSVAALKTAAAKGDGTWYIPKGNVHVNMDGYTIPKTENKTGTLINANLPYVDVYGHNVNDTNHRFVIGDTLGNNGKVRIKPETGIKLSKVIANADATTNMDEEFEFTVATVASVTGEHDAVKVAADGTETEDTVDFISGKATVKLKHGESIYITGLDKDLEFTITEKDEADFIVSKVVMDDHTIPSTVAKGTLGDGYIADVEFTNVPRGEGALTIAKQVVHPLGSDYKIDKTFEINVAMDGVSVSAGDEFKVERAGSGTEETVKLGGLLGGAKDFNITLKDGETVKILGIPEGTVVTVTEPNPGEGFTASYKENNVDGDGKITVVKEPTIDNVTVVNTYKPEPAKIKIDLSGVKTLVDENGTTIDPENWDNDLNFQFIIQKYVYEDGSWKWVDTENIDTASKTDGNKVDFLTGGRELTFDNVGVYGYQVIEKNHGLTIDGIVYDATMHTFNVIVTDEDMDGKLEAKVESSHGDDNHFVLKNGVWTNDQIDFVNRNNRGETSELIMIKKNLTNESGSTNVSLAGYQFEVFKSNADYTETGDKVLTTPVTDAAGETYVSLTYDYDDAGTHYYKLKEKATGIAGMTDSDKVYNFKVVVTANDDGSVTSEIIEGTNTEFEEFASGAQGVTYDLATFTNRYDPADATVSLDVTKKLEGKTLKADEFTFQITAKTADAPMPADAEVQNSANGDVDFGDITFDEVGTYEYTIQEVHGDASGVEYDDTVYDVVITVTDNAGKLTAAVDVLTIPGTEMVFENRYTPEPTEMGFDGDKELMNKELVGGQFAFTLAECDEAGNIAADGYKQTVTNKADGSFVFDEISYDDEGTYYYVISEEVPDNTQGIVYDNTKYLVAVEVDYISDTGEYVATKLISKFGGVEVTEVEFVNEYKAAAATAVVSGFKSLEGWALEDEQFGFNLYESDESWNIGNSLHATRNDAEGNFSFDFGEDYFKEAGTYYYIINETQGSAEGYIYDDKEVGVIVTVTDDMLGHLHASLSYVDLTRDGDKVIETPTAVVIFNNEYKPAPVELPMAVTKELTGRDWFDDDEFNFTIEAEDEDTTQAVADGIVDISDNTAVATKANKIAEFEAITFKEAGVYNFVISEVKGNDDNIAYDSHEVVATVTVTDNGVGKLAAAVTYSGSTEFVNDYTPDHVNITLEGEKVLIGRDLAEGEFTFKLEAVTEGAPMPAVTEVTNNEDEDGKFSAIEFGAIRYDEPGVYEYLITENPSGVPSVTDDAAPVKVTVTVEYDETTGIMSADVEYDKDGKDQFVFENIYKAVPIEISIDALKKVDASEGNSYAIEDGAFNFEIEPADFNPTSDPIKGQYVSNDADGKIGITAEYTEAGTYVYTLHEASGEHTGMIFDTSVYRIEVTVTDEIETGKLIADVVVTKDGDEVDEIVFNNEYIPEKTSAEIHGHKHIEGKALENGEFSFTIKALTENAPLPAETTVKNTDTGLFQFGAIVYDQVGTYEYEVSEVNEGKGGYSYDDSAYKVTVTVTDEGGMLEADVDGVYTNSYEPIIVFNNSYKPDDVTVTIGGNKDFVKNLDGREIKEGEFEFALMDGETTIDTAKNDAEGYFQFNVNFTKAGTYNYTVVEKNTGVAGVEYDTNIYGVVFEVVDEDGKLKVESIDYLKDNSEADKVVFENTYIPAPTQIQISALKVLEGRELADGEFTFALEDADGKVLQTVQNAEDGTVTFEPIEYAETGTYTYKMYEEKGSFKDVVYDETVHEIVVEVTDDLNGNLTATVTNENAVPVFVNTYEPDNDFGGGDGNGTKTGDPSNMLPLMALATLSMIGVVGSLLFRRKKA